MAFGVVGQGVCKKDRPGVRVIAATHGLNFNTVQRVWSITALIRTRPALIRRARLR